MGQNNTQGNFNKLKLGSLEVFVCFGGGGLVVCLFFASAIIQSYHTVPISI